MNRRSLLFVLLLCSSLVTTIANPVIASAADDDGTRKQRVLAFLTNIDDETRIEFQKAWRIADGGVGMMEAVVLVYRMRDGSIQARSLGLTNEHKQFTFAWHPGIAAVVHTHPNSSNPQPAGEDIRIADRFGIPVCTITNRGMFVYDPAARKTVKLHDGLNWLNPSRPNSIVAER
ncbi:MAG: hypothetical protein AB1631_04805 [Acidobacteriota bacterium]